MLDERRALVDLREATHDASGFAIVSTKRESMYVDARHSDHQLSRLGNQLRLGNQSQQKCPPPAHLDLARVLPLLAFLE